MAIQDTYMRDTVGQVVAPKARSRSDAKQRPHLRIPAWRALVVLGLLIGCWYLWAASEAHKGLGFLVPYPNQVWSLGFVDSESRTALFSALGHSVEVTFVGLGIAIVIGVLWAMAMAQAKWAEQAFYPYAVMLQCVPILALVPLIGAL